MTKYRVWYQTVASSYVDVDAENEADAYDQADEADMPQLCAQCSGWGQDSGIELGEWESSDQAPELLESVDE